MIDKQRAIELREQGRSYKEISEALGCSLVWCKKNLKGTKKKDISDEDYTLLVEKGRGFDCITKGEIINKIQVNSSDSRQEYNKELVLAANRVKKKLSKEGDVIVRQAWIHPARARASFNSMLELINDLNDRLDEYVRMHLRDCGFENDDNYNSILAFMVMNSQFGQRIQRNYPIGVFEAISNAVDEIEERNGSQEVTIQEPKEYTFIKENELPY